MIVPPNTSEEVSKASLKELPGVPADPPPAYIVSSSSTISPPPEPKDLVKEIALSPPSTPTQLNRLSSSTSLSLPPELDGVRPVNYLSLSQSNNPIKGTYVIDAGLKIPAVMLQPLAEGETPETRPNLRLQTSNGHIEVDVWALDRGSGTGKGADARIAPVNVVAMSSNGSITLRLRDTQGTNRPPVRLTARTSNGPISLLLPWNFRGPLTVRTANGSLRCSPGLTAATTTFSESVGMRHAFIGDFSDLDSEEKWAGDELIVETANTTIRMQYDHEPPRAWDLKAAPPASGKGKGKGKSGFMGKMLGRA